jgi:asparaginyl-tRNA synthetase
LQVVVKKDCYGYEQMKKVKIGAAVRAEGNISLLQGREQPFEILATKVYLVANSVDDYPLQKKAHTMEFLREISHLRARSTTYKNVFRIRNEISKLIHDFFNSMDFLYLHSPILTSNDAEGAGESFNVSSPNDKNYFPKPASLTVSGQLNAEAYAQAFKRVYTFGPTFRAEKSSTSRHLSEF